MPSVAEHYEALLAPVYSWMVGGTEAAIAMGQTDLAPVLCGGNFAIDLGAGFGMHTIPLARAGWRVLAIDLSPDLLGQLSSLAEGLPVRARCGNLLGFAEHLSNGESADLVLCMGDTLTHLESPDAIATLSRTVAAHLSPRGRFVATFRDYSRLPSGERASSLFAQMSIAFSRASLRSSNITSRCMICFTSGSRVSGSPGSAAIASYASRPRLCAKPSWLQA